MTISAKHNPLIRKTGILLVLEYTPFYQYFLICGITPAGWSPDAWRWLVMVVRKSVDSRGKGLGGGCGRARETKNKFMRP